MTVYQKRSENLHKIAAETTDSENVYNRSNYPNSSWCTVLSQGILRVRTTGYTLQHDLVC